MAKINDRIEAMTEGQRAYEAKRAAKAGVSLEKWVANRDRVREVEDRRASEGTLSPKRPGLFGRLFRRKSKA